MIFRLCVIYIFKVLFLSLRDHLKIKKLSLQSNLYKTEISKHVKNPGKE